MTACMGILKWLINKHDTEDKFSILSPDGAVPLSAIQFAIERCVEYADIQKHLDLDKDYPKVWDHEWDQFLIHYHRIMHENAVLNESINYPITAIYIKAKNALNEMSKCWPELGMDGMKNVWILKPGNKCRGRGIQLIKGITQVEKMITQKLKYVVQKYIGKFIMFLNQIERRVTERPLLIYNTKFDIRQWFVVANAQPLTIWMYR